MGVLKRRKHEVTVVENVEAASTAAQSDSYRLVVLEADGLQGGGPALCRRLREGAKDPHCMILAAVDSTQPEHVEALLAAGADDYLTDLDDTEQLELRLTVAEHHLDGGKCSWSDRELSGRSPIRCCSVLRHAPYGVFRSDIAGKFLEVNSALVTILGYDSKEELLALDVARDVYRDPARRRRLVPQLIERGHLEAVEVEWKRKDGTSVAVLASARVLRDDRGVVVGAEGIVHNITEQRRTREALKATQSRLQYLVASSPAVIYTCAPGGDYATTSMTENVTLRMGYEAREFTEDPRFWADRIHPEDAPRIFAELPKVLETGHHVHEYRFLHGCGSYRWMRNELRLTRDASGRPLEIIGYCIDITERKQARQTLAAELQRSRLILETSMDGFYKVDLKGRFLDTNPSMCAISGYTREELLSMGIRNIQALENPREISQRIKKIVQSGSQRFETKHRRKDGKLLDVEISAHCCKLSEDEFLFAFVRDITKRRHAERTLYENEQRYRLIADNVSDLIWIGRFPELVDFANRPEAEDLRHVAAQSIRHWRFTYVSPAVKRLLGYDVDQALSLKFADLLPPDSYAHTEQMLTEELAVELQRPGGRRERTLNVKHRAKDGSIRWVEVTCTFWRDQENRPIGMLGVTRDITQRRQAEQELRQSESRFRTLFMNIPDVVVLMDRNGCVQYANRPGPEATMDTLIGSNIMQFVFPEHRDKYQACLRQAYKSGDTQTIEVMSLSGNWWSVVVVPIDEDEKVRSLMAICTDITEQKESAEVIQKEQQLLRHLLDLHESDRQLIAYEIHDGYTQYLTGALYNLQGFRELQKEKPADAGKTFDEGLSLIHRGISEARRLISGLRPPILDEFGIVAAIEYLACEIQESGAAEVDFVHDAEFQELASPLKSAVFRIVQESLTNACRHSQSDKIRIELQKDDGRIFINVRDWGIGFDPDEVEERRFGLQGIRERARLLGGHAVIETAPDQGTLVSVELPLVEAVGELPES